MDVYILRHGIAEEESASGEDRDRVLTAEGIDRTIAAGKALRKLAIEFDAILSSPFARAWQTAEIVADQLDCKKLLHPMDELAANSSAAAAVKELGIVARNCSSVLVVGHEPILSEMISLLLSASPRLSIAMKKGGLCKLSCVRADPGAARLEWLLTAKHLSRMA
jgi:phosphohistidine phosphatase